MRDVGVIAYGICKMDAPAVTSVRRIDDGLVIKNTVIRGSADSEADIEDTDIKDIENLRYE